jgi:hypothetical protein
MGGLSTMVLGLHQIVPPAAKLADYHRTARIRTVFRNFRPADKPWQRSVKENKMSRVPPPSWELGYGTKSWPLPPLSWTPAQAQAGRR